MSIFNGVMSSFRRDLAVPATASHLLNRPRSRTVGRPSVHNGQRKEEDKALLVQGNEEEVEQRPLPRAVECGIRTQKRPTVVFVALPRNPRVPPPSGKIEGQSCSPQGNQCGHQRRTRCKITSRCGHPGINQRNNAPQFIYLAVVAGCLAQEKAQAGNGQVDSRQPIE